MKRIPAIIFLVYIFQIVHAQEVQDLDSAKVSIDFENIYVRPISADSLSSTFLIWIKKEVKAHRHEFHTEHVYIVEGNGTLMLGDTMYTIKAGNWIYIPQNTIHRVRVTSSFPMKVISIQTPYFDGSDRILEK